MAVRNKNVNLTKYQIFARAAEYGSITKAAEALGYTQSAVSHSIGSLEKELGFDLMNRGSGGIQLTDEGKRLLPAVDNILESYDRLERIVDEIRGLDSGTVRIGAFTSVAVHWLPGIIKEFRALYPKVDLKLLNGDYHDINQWLENGTVDIGFVTLPLELTCECIMLAEDRLLAIIPADHPMAGRNSFPLTRIPEEDFISLLESSDQDARRAMDAAGVKPNIIFTTKDDYAIIAMVEKGLGISIIPELLLKGHNGNICSMELSPPAKRIIALAIPSKSKASPAVRRFADHICRWVEENRKD